MCVEPIGADPAAPFCIYQNQYKRSKCKYENQTHVRNKYFMITMSRDIKIYNFEINIPFWTENAMHSESKKSVSNLV